MIWTFTILQKKRQGEGEGEVVGGWWEGGARGDGYMCKGENDAVDETCS